MSEIRRLIEAIPEGHSEGVFRSRTYGISKTVFTLGKSFKIYAEELGGTEFISLNVYLTEEQDILKTCEMPEERGRDVLRNVQLLKEYRTWQGYVLHSTLFDS